MGAPKISEVAVQIEAIGLDNVRAALKQLEGDAGKHSEALSSHYSKAARHLTLVTNEAIRAGEVGGNALQKILTIGGDMAGMFGAGGAVVGAIAVAGLAIYNYFDRARKQMEEFANATRRELRSIRDMSAESGAKTISRAVTGDPLAVNDKGEIDRLGELSKAQLEEAQRRLQHGKEIGVDVRTEKETEYKITLDGVNKELAKRNELIARGLPLVVEQAEIEARATIAAGKKQVAKDEEAALMARITLLTKALVFDDRRAQAMKELGALEKDLRATIDNTTLSLVKRANAVQHLSTIEEALARKYIAATRPANAGALVSITSNGETGAERGYKAYGGPMANVTARPDNLIQDQKDRAQDWARQYKAGIDSIANTIKTGTGRTLGDAIYEGFSAAFHGKGLSGIFKAFGKTVLAGVGGIFTQLGQTYLEYGGIMQALAGLLPNPFTAGAAGLAIGAALVAMGAALGAVAQGSTRGPGATIPRPAEITNIKLVATSVADQARYEPQARIHQTIIGPNDAAAFRQIQQGLDNHARR